MGENRRNVQYWVSFAVAIAAMTCSASFSWTTPVIPKLHNNETEFVITDTEISWIVAAASPGAMAGCLVSSYSSDRFGRRATLLGSVLPFVAGTVFILTATKIWMLYLARFFWGLGAGLVQTVSMIYIAEIASKEIRGSLSTINRYMFNFGGFMVVTAGSIASFQTLSYMMIVLPVVYFVACWWIPETPYYLLKEGKVDCARKELMKLNGYRDEKVLEEKVTDMRAHVTEEMQHSGTLKELLTGQQYRKAIIISVGLRTTQLMAGPIPIQQYLGRIIQDNKTNMSVSMGLILYSAVRFGISVLSSVIVDKLGRRPLLISSYIGVSLTLAILGGLFYLHEAIGSTPRHFEYIILFGLILFTTLSTLGFDTLAFIIPAEIFPLNIKSIAMTSVNLIAGIMTFISVRGYQIVKDLTGLYGVFWFFASVALAGALFSYFIIPETRGKGLRQIQLEMRGNLYDEANEKLNKEPEDMNSGQELKDLEKHEGHAQVKAEQIVKIIDS